MMMRKYPAIIAVLLVFFSVFANAQGSEEYVKADKYLNDIYSTFIEAAGIENVQAIKMSQVAWIRFKEKHCNVNYEATSVNSVAPLNIDLCLRVMTENRSNEIKRIMDVKNDPFSYYRDSFVILLSIIEAIGYNKSEFIKRLNNKITEYGDAVWGKYVQATCSFSTTYIEDKRDVCEARLNYIYLRNIQSLD
jgi:hypothetical protein